LQNICAENNKYISSLGQIVPLDSKGLKETREVSFNPFESNGTIRPSRRFIYLFIVSRTNCKFLYRVNSCRARKLLWNKVWILWEKRGCIAHTMHDRVHVCTCLSLRIDLAMRATNYATKSLVRRPDDRRH